jgi:hypothetical protein
VQVAAPAVFVLVVILAVVSLVAGWPHQFGGSGSRLHVLSDFASSGTATAPPLFILVIFGLVAFTVGRRDRWGTAALVILLVLAMLMVVGSLGEALAAATPDVPRSVQYGSGAFGVLAALVLFVLGAMALRERRRRSGT